MKQHDPSESLNDLRELVSDMSAALREGNIDTFRDLLAAAVRRVGPSDFAQQRMRFISQMHRIAELEAALQLIAAPKRPDGTYNRCREACERVAKEALAGASPAKVEK